MKIVIDPLRYYDLEGFLLTDVRSRFAKEGSLGAFDFFSIIVWKANRAKTHIARRLRHKDPLQRQDLNAIVRDLTSDLARQETEKNRLGLLCKVWGFGLPMASAILAILWPDDFTVYDVRVCEQLGQFRRLGNIQNYEGIWHGYVEYRDAVKGAVPSALSLRDKDRYLWAKSVVDQLNSDIKRGFENEPDAELSVADYDNPD